MKSEEELRKEYYELNATRPIHRNIAILQTKLVALRTIIQSVEIDENSYERTVEILRDDVEHLFEEISYLQQEIPGRGGTEAEEDALFEIERIIKELDQMRWQTLDAIGYESPEISRAYLFPNGEDED